MIKMKPNRLIRLTTLLCFLLLQSGCKNLWPKKEAKKMYPEFVAEEFNNSGPTVEDKDSWRRKFQADSENVRAVVEMCLMGPLFVFCLFFNKAGANFE